MSEARVHAVTASELLVSVERLSERLERMSPEDRLQAAVTGGLARANSDMHWTVDLATANALAAIALALTEGRSDGSGTAAADVDL